jgi:hypothetical protein
MTVLTPPGYVQGGTYTAKLDRIYLATLGNTANLGATYSARQGFFGGRVPVYANPSVMNVTIGACGAIIANTFASASGDYLMANDATVQVTLAASSPTQNRIDVVGFQVKDNLFDSSGLNTAVPAVIQGSNSAGTPSSPALPSSFIPVVSAAVNAGATTPVLTSLIRKTAADGGLVRIANVTERAEVTGYEGLQIYREDRDWVEVHDGTAWRVADLAICTSTADRDAAVTNPRSGQLAMTTDTDTLWQYDGATSAWLQVGGVKAPRGALATPTQSTADVVLSTTPVLCDTLTFFHTQGRYERARFTSRFSLNTNGVAIMQFKLVAGAGPVTSANTSYYETIPTGSGSNNHMNIEKTLPTSFRALASGTYTIGVFATAAAGAASGTINGGAGGIEREFAIYDDGAP